MAGNPLSPRIFFLAAFRQLTTGFRTRRKIQAGGCDDTPCDLVELAVTGPTGSYRKNSGRPRPHKTNGGAPIKPSVRFK